MGLGESEQHFRGDGIWTESRFCLPEKGWKNILGRGIAWRKRYKAHLGKDSCGLEEEGTPWRGVRADTAGQSRSGWGGRERYGQPPTVWGQDSKGPELCFQKTPLVVGAGRGLGSHLRNAVLI